MNDKFFVEREYLKGYCENFFLYHRADHKQSCVGFASKKGESWEVGAFVKDDDYFEPMDDEVVLCSAATKKEALATLWTKGETLLAYYYGMPLP